jgi:hypothetical protein
LEQKIKEIVAASGARTAEDVGEALRQRSEWDQSFRDIMLEAVKEAEVFWAQVASGFDADPEHQAGD